MLKIGIFCYIICGRPLSCGEESMTIYSAVLIQYQRVTDGQTDRQIDVQPISITCFSIADARKNAGAKANKFTCTEVDKPVDVMKRAAISRSIRSNE